MKTQTGFTLVELVVTVVVIGILAGLAAPAFTDFIRNERIVSEANDIIGSFYLARTEALKRNRRVTICKSSNPQAAVPACDPSTTWETGYIIFTDGNPLPGGGGGPIAANRVFEPGAPNLEVLIKTQNTLPGGLTLRARPADATIQNYVSYLPRGLVRQTVADGSTAQTGVFRLCDVRGVADMRAISLSQTGRVRVLSGAPAATAAGNACP